MPAEERRLRVLEARMVAAAAAVDDHQVRSKPKHRSPGFVLSVVLMFTAPSSTLILGIFPIPCPSASSWFKGGLMIC